MSLSDFSHFARSILDELFLKPEFKLKEPIKAVPLTRNYQTLGTAFDYALRILVSKLNPSLVNDFPLTAKSGIKGDKRRRQFIEDFEEKRKQFARGDISFSCLLADCIILAKLESVARTGNNFPNSQIFEVDERDVEDIQNLVELVNPNDFKANHTCVLNPVFGKSSKGGRRGCRSHHRFNFNRYKSHKILKIYAGIFQAACRLLYIKQTRRFSVRCYRPSGNLLRTFWGVIHIPGSANY